MRKATFYVDDRLALVLSDRLLYEATMQNVVNLKRSNFVGIMDETMSNELLTWIAPVLSVVGGQIKRASLIGHGNDNYIHRSQVAALVPEP